MALDERKLPRFQLGSVLCSLKIRTKNWEGQARIIDISEYGIGLQLINPPPHIHTGEYIEIISNKNSVYTTVVRSLAYSKRVFIGVKFREVNHAFLSDLMLLSDHDPIIEAHRDTIEQVVLVTNEELLKYLTRHPEEIYKISSRKFEEIIADIWSSFDFMVELTASTKDGGYDILAVGTNLAGVDSKYVIECKKYKKTNKVGVAIARSLLGVQQYMKAHHAILATTSYFTGGVWALKRNESLWSLDLRDYDGIIEWLNQYKKIKGL